MSIPDDERAQVRIRRAPKFSVFLIVGAVVGVVVAFILTALFPVDKSIGFGPVFGYFALFGVIGGLLVGALVALIFERVLGRRGRILTATVARLEPEWPEDTPATDTGTTDTGTTDTGTTDTAATDTAAEPSDPDATEPRATS